MVNFKGKSVLTENKTVRSRSNSDAAGKTKSPKKKEDKPNKDNENVNKNHDLNVADLSTQLNKKLSN